MPSAECTLILKDWTRDKNGAQSELVVSNSLSIAQIRGQVAEIIGLGLAEANSILLFVGTVHLEDNMILKDYNKSNRSRLNVEVYERVEISLRVRTLQHLGSGGCVCVPLWAFLCRQTINITIADHETVEALKKKVADELADPERMPWEKLKIVVNGEMLEDNKVVIKDLGLKNNSSLTLFVDCMYWRRRVVSEAASGGAAVSEQQPRPSEEREEDPKCVEVESHDNTCQEQAAKDAASDRQEEQANEEGGL